MESDPRRIELDRLKARIKEALDAAETIPVIEPDAPLPEVVKNLVEAVNVFRVAICPDKSE